ncbi:MAG: MarR family transcriptional regulator [Verrucomicrobia bacterium]|nr:MarR family transcriptional regulator [Verrucomicrobiota bacterium]
MPGQVPFIRHVPRYEVLQEAAHHYPGLDPSSCYAFLHLLKTADEILTLDADFLSSMGSRQGRFNLMMMVAHCAHCFPAAADLAECTGVSRATITGLLDGLERDGLVERLSDPEDRRVVRVKLTPQGEALLERVRPAYFRWFARMLEPLAESEREHLVYLLQKVQGRIADLSEELHGEKATA